MLRISATTASNSAARLPLSTTLAPSVANSKAAAAPMPLLAPAMTIDLFSSSMT